MTEETALNIYDRMPYPSFSFTRSHPDHLATLATLLGMDPPPVEHCWVLELGCGSGGNLIPMAQGLPESEFVGIDLSARQIAEGRAMVDALGLKNITLKHVYAPHFVLEISEHPVASPVARFQAQTGTRVTNLRHERVNLDGVSCHLLRHLDGSRDRAALLDALEELVAEGIIEVQQDNEPVKDVGQAKTILDGMLDSKLCQLARAALLVG